MENKDRLEKLKQYRIDQDCMPLILGDYANEDADYHWCKVSNKDEYDDICGDKEYVGYLWGATNPKIDDDCIEDICKRYERKHPEIVNWFKKKKGI